MREREMSKKVPIFGMSRFHKWIQLRVPIDSRFPPIGTPKIDLSTHSLKPCKINCTFPESNTEAEKIGTFCEERIAKFLAYYFWFPYSIFLTNYSDWSSPDRRANICSRDAAPHLSISHTSRQEKRKRIRELFQPRSTL